jgi:hypothetical protein
MLQTIDKVQEADSSEAVDKGLLKILASMPASLKVEIFHYAEYLLQKNVETETTTDGDKLALEISETETPKKKSLAGCMKGTFVLPLPEDFNETIDDFEQAEEKYGYGSLAGKITMSDDFDEPLEDLKEYM